MGSTQSAATPKEKEQSLPFKIFKMKQISIDDLFDELFEPTLMRKIVDKPIEEQALEATDRLKLKLETEFLNEEEDIDFEHTDENFKRFRSKSVANYAYIALHSKKEKVAEKANKNLTAFISWYKSKQQ